MKKILFFLIFSSALNSNAQIINFPDPDFKSFLVNYPTFVAGAEPIDTNGDGEIQESEAYNYGFTLAGQPLKINNRTNITDLTGINYFTTIAELQCYNNNLLSLDVSSLNISFLYCSNNPNLSGLILSNPNTLRYVWSDHCNIQNINLNGYTQLRELGLNYNSLDNINVSGCTGLVYLYVNYNQLTSLDVTGLPLINNVQANHNQLSQILFSPDTPIWELYLNQNQLINIDINGTTIRKLECQANLFTTLNFSNCPQLNTLKCDYNQQLSYLNLKDGYNLMVYNLSSFSFCPNLAYVCADQDEIAPLQAYFTQNAMPNVNVDSYCSFVPGSNAIYTISGKVRFDIDNNGCTTSDPLITYTPVQIHDVAQGTNTYSSYPNGGYFFYTAAGNYTVTPFVSPAYFNVSPATPVSVSVGSANPNQVSNFCLTANGIHPDLEVTLIPTNAPTAGFAATYQLVYTNKGTQTLSGNVQLSFDDARLDLVTANPAATSQLPNSLSWTYASLTALESRTININFYVLPPPVNNNGDSLNFVCTINPVAADEVPADNTFATTQEIIGSFDPNDKTCLEGKFVDITHIGDYFHYVIRFQNTGTGVAYNVLLKDFLSANFDWSSLKIIKASHNMLFRQNNGNDAEFFFPNIGLPTRSSNEAASHGFVAFKIRSASTLVLQDSLINKASIYFDFNPPVITEDAITLFNSAAPVPVGFEYFKGQKQESNNVLSWKTNCADSKSDFSIERSNTNAAFEGIGNVIANPNDCLQPFNFTDASPVNGINYYRIKMRTEDGKISYSNTIALLNNNTSFEIMSLAPNPVTGKVAVLNIIAEKSQQINILVTDVMGRSVYNNSRSIPAGTSRVEMKLANLSKGVYNMTIFTREGERKTLRFLKG